MGVKLGFNGNVYRDTAGSFSSPTWNLIPNVKDVSVDLADDEADASQRGGSGWKMLEPTMRGVTITFEMVYDTADADFTTLRDAYLARTLVLFAIADGLIASSGTQYIKADCKITGMQVMQALGDIQKVAFTIKPSYSANIPTKITV